MITLSKTRSDSIEAKRALLAERLRQAAAAAPKLLSFAQQRLWFLDQLDPNSPLYNIVAVSRVTGKLDLAALGAALNGIIERHEALRSRFVCRDENPVQVVDDNVRMKFAVDDLEHFPGPERELRATDCVHQEAARPFNFAADHLVRARIIRLGPEEHRNCVPSLPPPRPHTTNRSPTLPSSAT